MKTEHKKAIGVFLIFLIGLLAGILSPISF